MRFLFSLVRRGCSRGVLAVILITAYRPACAQTDFSWNVAAGNFNTGSNWTPLGPPGASDRALINNGGTSTYSSGNGLVDELFVGENAGNSGTLQITGGSLSPNKAVFGERGTAVVSLSNADLPVGGGSLFIGGTEGSGAQTGNGTLTVSGGAATTFSSGDDLQFGASGTGTLNMSGGRGFGVYTVIGKFGTGTWNQSGGVYDQAGGDFEIGDGGRPDQADTPGPRTGTVNLSGGVMHGHGQFALGNRKGTGTANITGGVLDLTGDTGGGGTIFVGRGMDWEAGQGGPTALRVKGASSIIVANGNFEMNTLEVASSSTLIAEITGPTHTPIKVVGDALIANGSLKVELNGYTPVSGNSWTLLEAGADISAELTAIDALVNAGGYPALVHEEPAIVGALTGPFASTDFSLAPLTPGLSWQVSYAANKVTLSITGTATFTADFNNDTRVNNADLLKWKGDFGQNAGSDANSDGKSDGRDFLIWQQQFGSGPPVTTAAAQPAPEPSAVWLVALGVVGLLTRRRQ